MKQAVSFASWKQKALANDETLKEFQAQVPEFSAIAAVIETRIKHQLTQAQLASLLGTKQSAISRLESGTSSPTISFLSKIAQALDCQLEIRFTKKAN